MIVLYSIQRLQSSSKFSTASNLLDTVRKYNITSWVHHTALIASAFGFASAAFSYIHESNQFNFTSHKNTWEKTTS